MKSNLYPRFLSSRTSAFLLGVAAAFIAGWALNVQRSQYTFEQNRATSETLMQIGTFWDTNLDVPTRQKTLRLMAMLETMADQPRWTQRDKLLQFLVDKTLVDNATAIRENPDIMKLVRLASGASDDALVNEVFSYRAAVTRFLNTLEIVATVRESEAHSGLNTKAIDNGYEDFVHDAVQKLQPFIDLYQHDNKDPTAWKPLLDLVNAGDWRK